MPRTKLHIRYEGECSTCERTVVSTPVVLADGNNTTAWVRCSTCESPVHCDKTGETAV